MSSGRWGDEDTSDHAPPAAAESSGGPPTRKKLSLKPRGSSTQASNAAGSTSKSSIFGAAKPREEVLASKGIDAKLVDERITKKATTVHYTREQDEEIQAIQAELTKAEADLRDANERELPEESFRVVVDTKRKELHDLMEKYTKENAEKRNEQKEQRKHYERPSERRKRLEEEHGGEHHDHHDNRYDYHDDNAQQEDPFQHFGGRNKHHSNRDGGGSHRH